MGSDLFLFELLSEHEPEVPPTERATTEGEAWRFFSLPSPWGDILNPWCRFMGSTLFLSELLSEHEPTGHW